MIGTVEETEADECQSHVDVGVTGVLEGEEAVGEDGVGD